ncbi:hypothetical protein D9M69_342430 [compost metagenome]
MPPSPEGAIQVAAVRTRGEPLHSLFEQYGDMAEAAGRAHRIRSRSSSGRPPGCLIAMRSASEIAFQASSSHS